MDKAVVYVDKSTSLEETCKYLGVNGISAVPILDQSKNQFIGMVDIVDISCFVAHAYGQKKTNPEGLALDIFKDVKAADLLPLSEEGKLMWSFNPAESIEKTLEPFCKGIHRALVTSEGDQRYHILSQMDVIKYIYKSGKFNTIFNKPMNDIPDLFKFKPENIETMDGDSPAIEGFKKLSFGNNKLGAIAILDKDGKLIGNLSATDMKGVCVEFLIKSILRPAKSFMNLVHGRAEESTPVVAKFQDTLGSVVEQMITKHVHRVWIVDDQGKLQSLISLSDVCRVFADL